MVNPNRKTRIKTQKKG